MDIKKIAGIFFIAGVLVACSNNGNSSAGNDSTIHTTNTTDTASRMTTSDSASASGTRVTNASDSM